MHRLVKKLVKKAALHLGIEIRKHRPSLYDAKVVSLNTNNSYNGNVLISYRTEPFLPGFEQAEMNSHTNYWESLKMAETFLELEYCVDLIDFRNTSFIPQKKYSIFIGARTNFERISQLLNKDCIKIVHLDTAHWIYNNYASYKRCLDLQERKKVTVRSARIVEENLAIEYADYATILGNLFTIGTYSFAGKPIYRLPVPTCKLYPWPEEKNFETARKAFLWFGSGGLVHKGLDIVLDVFVENPDLNLVVCGPIEKENDFARAFYKQLYETPNIQSLGWIDVGSSEFVELANRCVGLIYPSCSEGQAGAVVTCLQAGLIPIISYQSGVDVGDFGLILNECSIQEVGEALRKVSALPKEELKGMAYKAWEYARTKHSRENYAKEFRTVVCNIVRENSKHKPT